MVHRLPAPALVRARQRCVSVQCVFRFENDYVKNSLGLGVVS